jgi:hypothetical protein
MRENYTLLLIALLLSTLADNMQMLKTTEMCRIAKNHCTNGDCSLFKCIGEFTYKCEEKYFKYFLNFQFFNSTFLNFLNFYE